MTTTITDPLWQKIQSFTFSKPDIGLTFEQRLERENHWTPEYTIRVIGEYKRFLYLLALSDSEITPSDAVDQAWHLHLTYTRSYWKALCKDCLGFELHHDPTAGGQKEQDRFRRQYRFTLSEYRQIFQEDPPQDIWPDVERRFQNVEAFRRVNAADVWVIPKFKFTVLSGGLLVCLPLVLAACHREFDGTGLMTWLKVLGAVVGIYLIIKLLIQIVLSSSGRGHGGGGCGGGGCGGCGGGCGG